jgi:hypothetical protein
MARSSRNALSRPRLVINQAGAQPEQSPDTVTIGGQPEEKPAAKTSTKSSTG